MRRRLLKAAAVLILLMAIAGGLKIINTKRPVPDWSETASVGVMLREYKRGVCIVAVRENSAAAMAGIEAGDHLLAVNGIQTTDCSDVDRILSSLQPQEKLLFLLERGGETIELALR